MREEPAPPAACIRGGAPHPLEALLNAELLIRILFMIAAALTAAGIMVVVLKHYVGHDFIHGLGPKFDLDAENSVPSWFSSALLLLSALLLSAMAVSQGGFRTMAGRFHGVLAMIFVLLSLDEAASFHEALSKPLREAMRLDGIFYYAWVVPGSLFVLAIAVWSVRALQNLPRQVRLGYLLAGGVYCSGALGLEFVESWYHWTRGQRDVWFACMAVIEESLEMIGVILFLRALLRGFANQFGSLRIEVTGLKRQRMPFE